MGDNSFALEYRLRELDPELHRRFTNCVFALQRILSNYKLIFPEYTDHSELHSITVIDFCRRLIGNQIEKLDKDELYVLLLSCYFHDSGMGITQKDYEAFSKQIDFGNYFELHPNATQAEQIRDFHNEYSGLFIRKYAELFEFPSKEHMEAIIQTSRGHRKTDLLDEHVYPIELPTPDGDEICTPYLAALVRLADEIDVTASRNPKMLYDIDAITDEKQLREHLRHRAIHDMIISRDAFTLYYDDSDESINDMIKTLVEKMNRTLNNCRKAVNGRTIFKITQREVLAVPLR